MNKFSKEELEKIQEDIKKSRNLQKLMEDGVLSEKEALDAFQTIADIIKKHRKGVDEELSSFRKAVKSAVSETDPRLFPVIKRIWKRLDDVDSIFEKEDKTIRQIMKILRSAADAADVDALRDEIAEIRNMIPEEQEENEPFDPSNLEAQIEKLNERLDDFIESHEDMHKGRGILGIGRGGGGMNRAHIADYDLSPQLDGVAKTFNIPAVYNIITVALSSFPNILRKGIDYSHTGQTITFSDEIDAATSLAAGQTCILTVVKA